MRLNSKIKFLKETRVQQPDGGFVVEKTTQLETWARVEQLQVSKDIEQAQQILPKVFRVWIRDRQGFFPAVGNIVKFQNQEFVIINSPKEDFILRTRLLMFDIK